MKNVIFFIQIWIICQMHFANCCLAQTAADDPASHSVEFSYRRAHIDRNLSLDYHFGKKRSNVSLGLKYHLWWPIKDNQGYAFFNRGNPQNKAQYWGLNVGYRHTVLRKPPFDNFNASVFFSCQISYLGISSDTYIWLNDSIIPGWQNLFSYYVRNRYEYGAKLVFENTGGICVTTKITKRFCLTQAVGAGIMVIPADPLTYGILYRTRFSFTWDVILPYYQAGIQYTFPQKVRTTSAKKLP